MMAQLSRQGTGRAMKKDGAGNLAGRGLDHSSGLVDNLRRDFSAASSSIRKGAATAVGTVGVNPGFTQPHYIKSQTTSSSQIHIHHTRRECASADSAHRRSHIEQGRRFPCLYVFL